MGMAGLVGLDLGELVAWGLEGMEVVDLEAMVVWGLEGMEAVDLEIQMTCHRTVLTPSACLSSHRSGRSSVRSSALSVCLSRNSVCLSVVCLSAGLSICPSFHPVLSVFPSFLGLPVCLPGCQKDGRMDGRMDVQGVPDGWTDS
jgi:hypothetical protein